MKIKEIAWINRETGQHWVGDGFPVTTLLSYTRQGQDISPFLLLDYAGPAAFEPSSKRRGVEKHPHRGFETVTIVYQGEIEHKDNAGNSGKIGPGDVQWMTAARGILHEEMHGRAFTEKGGILEMVQLWVNLPAKDKMSDPHYQKILNDNIPVVNLDGNGGMVRVIAGDYKGTKGAAKTFTPVNLWDIRLKAGHKVDLLLPEKFTTNILVLSGSVQVNGEETLSEKELILFEREGDYISLEATNDASILIMNGEPIDEPITGQGPFVMNTHDEIRKAMEDYRSGRF